jgi:peptidoglycan hydrolase-like protein with peptidoglycan-binding domain
MPSGSDAAGRTSGRTVGRTVGRPARLALVAAVAALAVQPFAALPSASADSTSAGSASAGVSAGVSADVSAKAARVAAAARPRPARVLPARMDATPTYQDQRSCDPAAKPGVAAYAQLVLSTYRQGRNGGIVRGCGIGATSEHKEGRAFDWMLSVKVPAEKAAGDAWTAWLTGKDSAGVVGGNARRLGVMYVIWNKRMWSTYSVARGWRAYSGASAHTDHVHTSFTWDGAMKRTSWWDGTATLDDDKGPCRVYSGQPAPVYTKRHASSCSTRLAAAPASPYSIVWPGQSGSSVRVAQSRLGLGPDGVFGSGTRSRLMSWQRGARVPVTGVLDKPTWSRLAPSGASTPTSEPATPTSSDSTLARTTTLTAFKATTVRQGSRGAGVSALQRALGIGADGAFGPGTMAAVKAFQSSRKLPTTGVAGPSTWLAVERAAYPLLPYRSTTLRQGSRGAAVTALQRALRVTADGGFGARTKAAVQAAQTRAHRPATGVVDVRTWLAVEQQAYPLGRRLVAAPSAPKPTPSAVTTSSVSAYKGTVLRKGARGNAVKALQRGLGMKSVNGVYDAHTAGTVAKFQKARKLRATGVVDRATWNAVERVAHPLLAFRKIALRQGSRGWAVKAVQWALHLPADGTFGTRTRLAVRSVQTRARLKVTGAVDTATWVALERQSYPLGKRRW